MKIKAILYVFVLMSLMVLGVPVLELLIIHKGWGVFIMACALLLLILYSTLMLAYYLIRMCVYGGKTYYLHVTILLAGIKTLYNIWHFKPEDSGSLGSATAFMLTVFSVIYCFMFFKSLNPTPESIARVYYDDMINGKIDPNEKDTAEAPSPSPYAKRKEEENKTTQPIAYDHEQMAAVLRRTSESLKQKKMEEQKAKESATSIKRGITTKDLIGFSRSEYEEMQKKKKGLDQTDEFAKHLYQIECVENQERLIATFDKFNELLSSLDKETANMYRTSIDFIWSKPFSKITYGEVERIVKNLTLVNQECKIGQMTHVISLFYSFVHGRKDPEIKICLSPST